MILKKASFKAMKYSCLKFHYAKTVPINPVGYSVFNKKNEWCGCVIYGYGANPNLAKSVNLRQGQVAELTRMALNGKQEVTSKVLALSIKLFKKENTLIKLLISFADKNQNHKGTIYQATNWHYTGLSKSTPKWLIDGVWKHQRTALKNGIKNLPKDIQKKQQKDKIRYYYPLDKSLINFCKELSKPYLKNA